MWLGVRAAASRLTGRDGSTGGFIARQLHQISTAKQTNLANAGLLAVFLGASVPSKQIGPLDRIVCVCVGVKRGSACTEVMTGDDVTWRVGELDRQRDR